MSGKGTGAWKRVLLVAAASGALAFLFAGFPFLQPPPWEHSQVARLQGARPWVLSCPAQTLQAGTIT